MRGEKGEEESRVGERSEDAAPATPTPHVLTLGRTILLLGLLVYAAFYLMLTMGAASFVHECETFLCGQLHQAVFAGVAAVAVVTAAYRSVIRQSGAVVIVFLGTLPILIVHILLVMSDPNEAIFFPLSTTPPTAVSGALLLFGFAHRRRLPSR